MAKYGRRTVEVTGSASGFASTEVFKSGAQGLRGLVRGVVIRLDVTDNNASSILAMGVCRGDDLANQPADDDLVFETAAVALTSSAIAADLDTMFDNPKDFENGLRVGGNVTATGAYKLFFTIHYEMQDR